MGKNGSEERRKDIGREEGKGGGIREKINVAEVQCSLLPLPPLRVVSR